MAFPVTGRCQLLGVASYWALPWPCATPEQVGRCTLLAWAMVYNKVQGSTEKGTICLHGCSSPYFRKCHLYVGLSRVTAGSNVFVASD